MLRRAITGHCHHHRLCVAYTQWLHPTVSTHSHTTLYASPDHYLDLKNRTTATRRRPFSTSFVLRRREEDSEASSPLADHHASSNSSSPIRTTSAPSSASSESSESNNSKLQVKTCNQDDVLVADSEAGSSNSRTRTQRTRVLRPLLIPPFIPPDLLASVSKRPRPPLLPTTSLYPGEEKRATDADTDASSSATTISLADLPPNTLKTDIRHVFQRYGDVKRIIIEPSGHRAEVLFSDADAVTRVLHAYAEVPLRVRGEEIVVFRKRSAYREPGVKVGGGRGAARTRHNEKDSRGNDEGDGAIFVSGFPAGTTQEELLEALAPLGKSEGCVMRPNSKYAYVLYSSGDSVEDVLRAHERLPVAVRRQTLRIERSRSIPYVPSDEPSAYTLEIGALDPAESSAVLKELKETVPRWRGSSEPSRVLWIGRLPWNMDKAHLINFWSRLGCVAEVRTSTYGFAHVEFASTEEAIRAARQGAPHGFRYENRLLDVDFAQSAFYVGSPYHVVYISGWLPSNSRIALSQWANDTPNVVGVYVLAPFRREARTDPRGAFLRFRSVDDARAALRALTGRKGPGGETLRLTLSRVPAVHLNELWRWADIQEGTEDEAAYFKNECGGLGFGTGSEEEQLLVGDESAEVSVDDGGDGRERKKRKLPTGVRGGRYKHWMKSMKKRMKKREGEEDALNSHASSQWTHDAELGDENEREPGTEEAEDGERKSVPLSAFIHPSRRHRVTNMDRDSPKTDGERGG